MGRKTEGTVGWKTAPCYPGGLGGVSRRSACRSLGQNCEPQKEADGMKEPFAAVGNSAVVVEFDGSFIRLSAMTAPSPYAFSEANLVGI
jgi:hypothetical protein